MANILRSVQEVSLEELRPHRLGLTGSRLNGALRNADTKLEKLLQLMDANMMLLEVSADDLGKNEARYLHVSYEESDALATLAELATDIAIDLLDGLRSYCKDVDKAIRSSVAVYSQLGFQGWLFHLEHGVLHEAQCQAKILQKSVQMKKAGLLAMRNLPLWEATLKHRMEGEKKDQLDTLRAASPLHSGKVKKLTSMLQEFVDEDPDARIIVFVEEICVTLPLMDIINKHVKKEGDSA